MVNPSAATFATVLFKGLVNAREPKHPERPRGEVKGYLSSSNEKRPCVDLARSPKPKRLTEGFMLGGV